MNDAERYDIGSYFVSNYPPFQYWTADATDQHRSVLERPAPSDRPLGVYVHLPFCRKRCRFCYFKVYTDTPAAEVRAYVEAVEREASLYASRPYIQGRTPRFVYFGGGTPSYLSGDQLRSLFSAIRGVLPWAEDAEVAFECEPGTLRQPKVDALRELGVTRISLGIENFSDELLSLNGRAHGARHIQPAFDMCRRAGFPQVNIDLIAGMLGETDENWQDNIRRTIELQPDSVTIYQMEVPFNTRIHRAIRAGESLGGELASFETRRRWAGEAFEALRANGYETSSGYTAVRAGDGQRFVYRDSLWRGADMLGLGVSAFGHLGGFHLQNDKHLSSYTERVHAGELPLQRSFALTAEHQLIREVVLQLKLGQIDAGYFRDKFDTEITERFARVFEDLKDRALLAVEGDTLTLTNDALLSVDRILHDFFLPEHGGPSEERVHV